MRKVKRKKSILALVLLFLVVLIGATIAYYTSSNTFENEFTAGIYNITTTEVFTSPDNWKPGEEIPKTVTTKNDGTVKAAVRVSYIEKWEDSEGHDITSSIDDGTAIINLDNTSDWYMDGDYYYYKYFLEPGEATSSFIKSVTLNPELDGVTCTGEGLSKTCQSNNLINGAKYILTINEETAQADQYKEIWNTNALVRDYFACPGEACRYSDTSSRKIGQSLNDDQYNVSYSDFSRTTVYGYVLINNIIDDIYVCYTGDELFCLKGAVNETDLENKKAFKMNSDILKEIYPNCNINYNASRNYCNKAYDSFKVIAEANTNGVVKIIKTDSLSQYSGSYEVNVNEDGRTGSIWSWPLVPLG